MAQLGKLKIEAMIAASNRGHSYGTLGTTADWKWGDYVAHKLAQVAA